MDSQTIELILIAVIAAGVVVQTIVLIALVVAMGKAARSVHKEIEGIRSSIVPVVHNTREMIARVGPKIERVADDTQRIITHVTPKIEGMVDELATLTHSLRVQAAELQDSTAEVVGRAQRLIARLDRMASTVLNNVDRAANFVSGTVAKPVRQVSGVLASVRAIVETLRDYRAHPSSDRRATDENTFV